MQETPKTQHKNQTTFSQETDRVHSKKTKAPGPHMDQTKQANSEWVSV